MTHFKQDVRAPRCCWGELKVERRENSLQLPEADANLIHTFTQAIPTVTLCTAPGLLSCNQSAVINWYTQSQKVNFGGIKYCIYLRLRCKNVLKKYRQQEICCLLRIRGNPSWVNQEKICLLFWVPIWMHYQANHWIFENAEARCTMSPCCVKLTEQMDRHQSIVLLSWGPN